MLKAPKDVEPLLKSVEVSMADGIPSIRHIRVPFSQMKDFIAQQRGDVDELDVYELLHVLFDKYDDEFTMGLSYHQQEEYQGRIRKDRLSKYLGELIWRRHREAIKVASRVNAPTCAILQLTANNIHAACDALMAERDFHLALLVAQIGQADSVFQQDIAYQISAWREQNVISEMSEEIRALYEILSGNTTVVHGKQQVPAEDRASTFALSEKFELDWIQAFALCLWYGVHKDEEIHDVVADFQDKLHSRLESASPVATNGHEDLLWVILKLFASNGTSKRRRSYPKGVEKPVLPQALAALSRPWDSEKTLRLHQAVAVNLPGVTIDQEKADDLSVSMAFEQSARGDIPTAIYALLQISDPEKRAHQIKDLLNRHAASLPGPANQGQQPLPLWSTLTISLRVPASWIFRSKALYARSCNEPLTELHYLIHATDFAKAHECLLRRVAPRIVIDGDWQTLQDILSSFGEDAEQKVDSAVAASAGIEWKDGGRVYADFVELMALVDPSSFGRRGSGQESKAAKSAVLSRLQGALTELNVAFKAAASASSAQGLNMDRGQLEERVALCEMGKAVARVLELESDEGVNLKVCLPFLHTSRYTARGRAILLTVYRNPSSTSPLLEMRG